MVTRRELIQSGLMAAAACASGPSLFGAAQSVQDKATGGIQGQTWVIGNELIQRTVSYKQGSGLSTEAFRDLSTSEDFMRAVEPRPSRGQEFSFLCNGETCAGTNSVFELLNAREGSFAGGRSLTVQLRHRKIELEVSVVYRVYDGHPAIRKHLVLKNTGSSVFRITHLNVEAIEVTLGPENETTLLAQYGTIPREIFYTGRSEDAGLQLANGRTGAGIAILSEVPGYMKRTEIVGWDDPDGVRIGVGYDTDLMPFERSIGPGEGFTTACASLVTFRNGDGFHDPHWVLASYTAQVLMRRVDKEGAPWIYNTWEPFERGINRETTLALIQAAGDVGFDIFTIDDGWQQDYGENAVNLNSFPGGLKTIQEAVEARGMRLGLWIPVAAIATSSPDNRKHPEWASLDREGNVKTTMTMAGEMAVMCMATAFSDSAAERIVDAIERFHLAYVKLDLTTIFNAYGEAPGCWAKGHFHHNWAESLNMIYEGISAMTAAVYKKHPEVLLDLTFELWGQKHVIDAGLLAAGDLDWMSNVDDRHPDSAGPLQARQLLYQRAASMPVESMLIGNIHAELPTIQESFATAIGSAPLLLGDLRKLSAKDRKWYHEKISWFKELRRSTKISESFFPLGSWMQPTAAAWDGFARMARSGRGVIAIFRNKSNELEATVKLPLMPAGSYTIRSIMSGRELGVFGSGDWIQGIPIRFEGADRVEVLEVRPE